MKLKGKLVLGNMLMVVLTMGCLSLSQWLISSYYSDEILEETATNIAENFTSQAQSQAEQTVEYLSDALFDPMYFYDIDNINSILEPAFENKDVIFIKVFDANGLIVHTGEDVVLGYGSNLDMPRVQENVLNKQEAYTEINSSALIVARPITMNKTRLGGIVMSYSLKAVKDDIEKNNTIIKDITESSRSYSAVLSITLTMFMCLVSLLFSMLLAKTMIRPINQLLQHSKRISKGIFQVPNNIQRSDELGELAQAFDSMDSSLKQRNEEVEFLAYNDPLTKLPNRSQFIKCLERCIHRCKQSKEVFAVFFIDLDEFKRVNDNLGHQAGDELLSEVAQTLTNSLKKMGQIATKDEPQCMIARVGGDEFLLRLSGVKTQDTVSKFASDIVHSLKQPIYLNSVGESVVVGASVGVALYPDSGNTSEDLVKSADMAMYSAKENGKGRYCFFNQEIEQKILARGVIEKELRSAIDDFSQFRLLYQPKFDLKTGHVVGVEALIRWHHPTKGNISPIEFIPIAEATDIIHTLGDWIVMQACKDIQEWDFRHHLPPEFYVAINLSPKQLYGDKALRTFQYQTKKHQVEVTRLHIEVTETALMFDKVSAKKTLDDLRSMGIKVWLDDFGTGYSSLGFLREFNIDGLKIDRSFVNDLECDMNDRALCAAVVSMAHQLGIKVVAEGIETTIQSSFLAQSHCDYGQGYLLAKPMCAETLSEKLETGLSKPKDTNVIYLK
ncbi:EAL domain-containing protein [Vibrio sp. 10N.261.49.A5]|uniref:Diguanylate phosphodiesterase n=1 Tax=Vibrio tasmaniensis 1F-267 TaxID=1191324 RepID=A0ABX3B8X9_9VIBR|nr:bifunctional diguanylate cyclase/phosphodiesterase [Vibrio tasmaniensis]OEF52211.1 diguanylate phosphodiesterase [Vibrio tasmaniensis 1F-267]